MCILCMFVFLGEFYILDTVSDSEYNHGWVYPRSKFLYFMVKSCMEARLLLSPAPLMQNGGYEVLIGAEVNTNTM